MSLPKVVRTIAPSNHSRPAQKCLPDTSPAQSGSRTAILEPLTPGTMGVFLNDLRFMCQLIEEAGRYGATQPMETKYRRLRTGLTTGYRALRAETGIDLFPARSFHGCGFEMIFSSHSLDSLVNGPGQRVIDRLAGIWRAAQAVSQPKA